MSTPSASKSRRIALSQLTELTLGERTLVAGRIIAVHGDQLVMQDASGLATLICRQATTPGLLCSLTVARSDEGFVATEIEPHGGRSSAFGTAGDHTRLSGGEAIPLLRLHARAAVVAAIRGFFATRDYLEVETPLAVPSPGLDVHLAAFELQPAPAERYLITSPEYQMKRLLSAGAERIFQLCKCFRRDEAGPLHEPEFTMLEWYRGFSDMASIMHETELLVRHVADATPGAAGALRHGKTTVDVGGPFERLTVRDAFEQYTAHSAEELATDPPRFYEVLVQEIEPMLGRDRPTFLTHYPASMASLARRCPEDPSVAERFELYVDGIELCNGFGELTDAEEQRTRLEADLATRVQEGLAPYPIDERFLRCLEDGMPPSAGNALGVDRLVMLALGYDSIQDALAFPDATL